MQFVKRIGDNAVAVVEVVEKGFEGGKLSCHSFRFELFMKRILIWREKVRICWREKERQPQGWYQTV